MCCLSAFIYHIISCLIRKYKIHIVLSLVVCTLFVHYESFTWGWSGLLVFYNIPTPVQWLTRSKSKGWNMSHMNCNVNHDPHNKSTYVYVSRYLAPGKYYVYPHNVFLSQRQHNRDMYVDVTLCSTWHYFDFWQVSTRAEAYAPHHPGTSL